MYCSRIRASERLREQVVNFILPTILGVVGAFFVFLSGWRWLLSGTKRLCPGPHLSWSERLLCIWIAYQRRCAYDLSGHTPDVRGEVVCPECGRRVRQRRHLVRSPRALRPAGLAFVLFASAYVTHRHPPVSASTVVAMTPTNVLLRGEGLFGVGTPLEVRDEVRRRAMNFQLDDGQISRLVALLVNDLKDDMLLGNAADALERLMIFGLYDEGPLLAALSSSDAQQRRLAAEVLRDMPRDGDVPEALLRTTIEDLRADDVGSNARSARSYLYDHIEASKHLLAEVLTSDDQQQRDAAKDLLRNTVTTGDTYRLLLRLSVDDLFGTQGRSRASRGFDYLLAHAADAESFLYEGMGRIDVRQRLLCAAIAGCTSRTRLIDRATPILAAHLADNAIANDGVLAARALAGFGPEVALRLEPLRQSADEQQRQAVEYIIRRLTTGESPVRLQREFPLARLTLRERDALEVDIGELRMPDF